jgi:hypothetical protein
MGENMIAGKLDGTEPVIKTENFIVVGLIALGALLIIMKDQNAVAVTSNIISGLLGYMGRTAIKG